MFKRKLQSCRYSADDSGGGSGRKHCQYIGMLGDIMANRKIIVIGAHPDDYEIGAAMRLMHHAAQSDEVIGIICTDGEMGGEKDTRLKEAQCSADFIGIKKLYFLHYPDTRLYEHFNALKDELEKIIFEEKPSVVYLHYPHDRHQDHETASHASTIACRNVPNILFYKTPATTLASFSPHIFHVGSEDDFLKKREALACHKSQIESGRIDLERVKSDLRFYCFYAYQSPAYSYAEPFSANHIVLNLMEDDLCKR